MNGLRLLNLIGALARSQGLYSRLLRDLMLEYTDIEIIEVLDSIILENDIESDIDFILWFES